MLDALSRLPTASGDNCFDALEDLISEAERSSGARTIPTHETRARNARATCAVAHLAGFAARTGVVFVGPSGVGKSALINSLLQLGDPLAYFESATVSEAESPQLSVVTEAPSAHDKYASQPPELLMCDVVEGADFEAFWAEDRTFYTGAS